MSSLSSKNSFSTYDIINTVAVITIDNPPVNAVSPGVPGALIANLKRAFKDDGVVAIVLRGANNTFIAGADIAKIGQPWPKDEPTFTDLCDCLDSSTKPVIAALSGFALGGGSEIALSCNYRVAVVGTRLGQPEVNLGFPPGAGATQRLPRLLGLEHALDIIVSGRHVKAEEALSIGYIDHLFNSSDTVLDDAVQFAIEKASAGKPHPRCRDYPAPAPSQELFAAARAEAEKKYRGRTSPVACVKCIELSASLPFDQGLVAEREIFEAERQSLESRALRHVFLSEREVSKVPGIAKGTPTRPVTHCVVIGGGLMGTGIAMCFADHGMAVTVIEVLPEAVDQANQRIAKRYSSDVAKNRLSDAQAAEAISRIVCTTDRSALVEADLVVEAIFEDLALKQELFSKLAMECRDDAILASNTSYLDIEALAASSGRPASFVGMHFFSPAHATKLLEVVRTSSVDDNVLATALGLAKKLRKVPVVSGVCEGFIANRMFSKYTNAAISALAHGATPTQIDTALKSFGFPMGPLEVLDMAGLEIGWARRKSQPGGTKAVSEASIADRLCELSRFGQKTNRGFYIYEPGSRVPVPDEDVLRVAKDVAHELHIEQRPFTDERKLAEWCVKALADEGHELLKDDIAIRESDIDVVWVNGFGFPRHKGGPMFWSAQASS